MRTSRGALALLTGLLVCLGAVAYAAAPRHHASAGPEGKQGSATVRLPRPKIGQHPDRLATSTSARFAFSAPGRNPRFQCRLDARAWTTCRSPVSFAGLAPGPHGFAVRATQGRGHGRSARFRWTVLEPKDFSITSRLGSLDRLYPGAPPLPLPLTISNPNQVPILVTRLSVSTAANPAGCASAENLTLTDSSISSAAPLEIPAGGSVSLPAPGISAPTIQLRDLPFSQDACQGANFPLAFSGEARG